MNASERYTYSMTVKGSKEEQKAVFDLLKEHGIIDKHLEPDGRSYTPYAHYRYPKTKTPPDLGNGEDFKEKALQFLMATMEPSGPRWGEEDMEERLHEISMQVPGAILEIEGRNLNDRTEGFIKRFHGNMYQETRLVTTMPPLIDGADVPFLGKLMNSSNTTMRHQKTNQLLDQICHKTDYDLLSSQQSALEQYLRYGDPIPKEAIDGLIKHIIRMKQLGELLGRFQYDDCERSPYPPLPEYKKKHYVFEPEERKPVFVLTEEHAVPAAPRKFKILAVSEDSLYLHRLMSAKVSTDTYGYFAKNGKKYISGDCISSRYNQGSVSYSIKEFPNLSKDQLEEMLYSPEYAGEFKPADNLHSVIAQFMGNVVFPLYRNADNLDAERAASAILSHEQFVSHLRKYSFATEKHIVWDYVPCDNIADIIFKFTEKDPAFLDQIINAARTLQHSSLDEQISGAASRAGESAHSFAPEPSMER